MNTRFINATVLTMEDEKILYDTEVFIKGNIIDYVGPYREDFCCKDCEVIDVKGNLLMPGFVNTHCHAAMSLFRGIGEGANFKNWWIDYMRPLEEKLEDEDYYNGFMLSASEMIKNGITTVCDMYMGIDQTVKAVNDSGIRANICMGFILGTEELSENGLIGYYNLLTNSGDRIKPIMYCHAIYSTDEARYSEVIKFAKKYNLPITTHVSETLDEVGDCDKRYGVSPVGLLESYGFFDNTKTLLAHCVHLDKADCDIINNYDVTVSSNPSSNLYLGSGIAPINAYLNKNINVALGTDGSASNNSLNMFKEMFLVKNLQSGILNDATLVTSFNALKMATINGAKALDYSSLGLIKKGYLADIIEIDLKQSNMQPLNNLITNVVNSADVNNVKMTMINGKILFKDGKLLYLDEEQLINNANKSIQNIKNR